MVRSKLLFSECRPRETWSFRGKGGRDEEEKGKREGEGFPPRTSEICKHFPRVTRNEYLSKGYLMKRRTELSAFKFETRRLEN